MRITFINLIVESMFMTKLSHAVRAKVLEHRMLVEQIEKKEFGLAQLSAQDELQQPEIRLHERVLSDIQYKGIVARAVGKSFEERCFVAKKDMDRFALIYNMDRARSRVDVMNRLIALMKKGHAWESSQSRRLRRQYKEKAAQLLDMLDRCDFNEEFFADGAVIELADITELTSEHLEFCSASAIVDKKPKKKGEVKSGDAAFFQELYHRGKRAAVFGIFDGFVDGKGEESKPSMLALGVLKEYVEKLRNVEDANQILHILTKYANEADATISDSMTNFGGATASVGVVFGKRLAYLNLGDSRIYGVSTDRGTGASVTKLTTDDGICGSIDKGIHINESVFSREAEFPHVYVGSFSQQIRGKYSGKRVLHPEFRLRSPNIGLADLTDLDMLVAMSDGVWRQLPFRCKNGAITAASGEETIAELINSIDRPNPQKVATSIYEHARGQMFGKKKIIGDYLSMPSPEDSAVVALSI